nr:GNAT family N-acetyltransferase [Azospirillum oleiclasticum]
MGAVHYLVRQGFGMAGDVFERYRALFGTAALRVLRRDGDISACAAVFDVDQWFGGRPVPARGVACVTVDPIARGTGTGSALVRAMLEEARGAGRALSILYPATRPLYARAGYGPAGVRIEWSAPPAALAGPHSVARPTRQVPPDLGALAALRRTGPALANGMLERSEALWALRLDPLGEGTADLFLLPGADGPGGYAAVLPPRERRLLVPDQCVAGRRAVAEALAFLAGYRAQVDRVCWCGGPDDPLALLAHDSGVVPVQYEEWMLRVVDVERALTCRGYPSRASESLVLDVTDPLLPANHGRFRLTPAAGRGRVERLPSQGAADVALHIAALAPLYTGHRSPSALRAVGLVEGSDDAIMRAEQLFAGPRPWMADQF